MAFSVQRLCSVMESVPDLHSMLDRLQPRRERASEREIERERERESTPVCRARRKE